MNFEKVTSEVSTSSFEAGKEWGVVEVMGSCSSYSEFFDPLSTEQSLDLVKKVAKGQHVFGDRLCKNNKLM